MHDPITIAITQIALWTLIFSFMYVAIKVDAGRER